MAMRGFILGQKVVIKESGGKFFPARAVAWTDKPSARPEAVIKRNLAFEGAVGKCKAKSKYKHGTVWGISEYNECIAKELAG